MVLAEKSMYAITKFCSGVPQGNRTSQMFCHRVNVCPPKGPLPCVLLHGKTTHVHWESGARGAAGTWNGGLCAQRR